MENERGKKGDEGDFRGRFTKTFDQGHSNESMKSNERS